MQPVPASNPLVLLAKSVTLEALPVNPPHFAQSTASRIALAVTRLPPRQQKFEFPSRFLCPTPHTKFSNGGF